MSSKFDRVVFDCNVFAQALLNPRGMAAQCLDLPRHGDVELFASEYVLQEVRDLYVLEREGNRRAS